METRPSLLVFARTRIFSSNGTGFASFLRDSSAFMFRTWERIYPILSGQEFYSSFLGGDDAGDAG